MFIDLIEDTFEIDTFDAYNNTIYFVKSSIILPYVNIEIFNSNRDDLKKGDRLNHSYLIYRDVSNIEVNCTGEKHIKFDKRFFSNFSNKIRLEEFVSGKNIFNKGSGCEFKIKFNKGYLYIPDDFKIKNNGSWIPENTPNFKLNMEKQKVASFFKKESIPKDILTFIQVRDLNQINDLFPS